MNSDAMTRPGDGPGGRARLARQVPAGQSRDSRLALALADARQRYNDVIGDSLV
jgi:hypothetical protein